MEVKLVREYILSEAQHEIIQLEEYYENTSINNIAAMVTIKDNVSIEEIDKSLNNLIKKHESYRIKVKKLNSEYNQYIDEYICALFQCENRKVDSGFYI